MLHDRGTVGRCGLGNAEGWYVQSLQGGKAATGDLDGDARQEVAALVSSPGEICFLVKVMRREANRTLPYVATQSTCGSLATGPAGCCRAKGC